MTGKPEVETDGCGGARMILPYETEAGLCGNAITLSTAKPKARYAVIPQRFKNWTLPRLLPARMLDAELAKQMKLTRR